MTKKRLRTRDLAVGMIVADDIYSLNGQLILAKHSILSERLLAKLNFYSIPTVTVMEATEDAATEDETLSAVIKKSEEYKEFQQEFNQVTKQLDGVMDKLVEGGIKQEDIVDIVSNECDLFFRKDEKYSFMDMFHNMREMSDTVLTHSLNVSIVSVMLGRWLGFPKEEQELLLVAGLLHDVGKLEIPASILNKPDKLTKEELTRVRAHAFKGYSILKKANMDDRICEVALNHHERCDGSGYPGQLKEERISKYAKIIAIADVYDAMTAGRVYRDPICPFDVIRKFEDDGLQLYDASYIMTFLSKIASTYNHSAVRLSDGREGEVIMINKQNLSRPVVRVGEEYIDLSKEKSLKIDAVI